MLGKKKYGNHVVHGISIKYFFKIFLQIDPFADANQGANQGADDDVLVHIRIQQRNGRKTLTTVQGLSAEYDLKKIVRACKKVIIIIPL